MLGTKNQVCGRLRRVCEANSNELAKGEFAVPPAFEWAITGAIRGIGSSQVALRHPGLTCLGLLPSGPDPVHIVPPRRTRPSTPLDPDADPVTFHPRAGDQSRMKRISGSGHP